MPDMVPPGGTSNKVERFRGSLARSVLLLLLLLSLLPAAITSTVNYFRSRQLLHDQTGAQLQTIIHSQSQALNQLANQAQAGLSQLFSQQDITNSLQVLIKEPNDPAAIQNSLSLLQTFLVEYKSISGTTFSQIFVLSKEGKVLVSTDTQLIGQSLPMKGAVLDLVGTEKVMASYNFAPIFTDKWILFSTKPITDGTNTNSASVIAAIQSPVLEQVLKNTDSIYPTGKAYFFTKTQIFQYLQSIGNISPIDPNQAHLNQLLSLVANSEGLGNITSTFGMPVLAYASWLPQLQMGFVVEEPETSIYNVIDSQIPINIGLVLIIFLVLGVFVYFAAMQVVTPLRQLAGLAKDFAGGDWSKRASVKRKDEIGLLAYSFNQMAEQMSGLYGALETKVVERAKQIRSASEFTQIAVASSSLEEIFLKTLDLLVSQFGFTFASIFLLDETGNYLVLQESQNSISDQKPARGYRIPIAANTLMSWVAINNQTRVVPNIPEETFYHVELLLTGSLSEAAVPISLGNTILGVIEIQSPIMNGFDPEIIATFVTLANQVASGIQNIRLLESAQINLAETSLLYRTSRQISVAKEDQEVISILASALKQTAYVSGIYSVEEDHLTLIALSDPKNPDAIHSNQGITLSLQKAFERLRQENLILIDNINQLSDFSSLLAYFARAGCHSAALIAVHKGEQLSNVIILGSRESTPVTSTMLQPFGNLVEVVSSSLERLDVLQTLQRRLNELQTLASVGEAITQETDLKKLFEVLYAQISKSVGGNIEFSLSLFDEKLFQIETPYLYRGEELVSISPKPFGSGPISYVIVNHQALLIVKDAEQKARALGIKPSGKPFKSWLGVPLFVSGKVIGVMSILDEEREEAFSENDLHLFNALAPQIAITIHNAQLLSEMQQTLKDLELERYLLNTWLVNTPDFVYFKDAEGKYLRVSKSYAKRLGLEQAEQLIGHLDVELERKDDGRLVQQEDQEIFSSGSPKLRVVKKEVTKDGIEIWTLNNKIRMVDQTGQPAGIFATGSDISESVEAEQLSQQRSQQIRTAAEIARDTASTLQVDDLLQKSVNMIRDRFGFYHASIFLLDPLNEYAILRESTGEAGARMKAGNHKLAVGSKSIVGQATQLSEHVVVNDVTRDNTYYPNPLLPDTRSELAIPLMVGNTVLGALDVQSIRVNAFLPEDIQILQILADQLAIAVFNGNLFAQAQENLAEHRLLHQITTAATSASSLEEALATTVGGLQTALGGDQVSVFFPSGSDDLIVRAAAGYENIDLSSTHFKYGEGAVGLAALEKRPILISNAITDSRYVAIDNNTRSQLAVPILYSDTLLGVLNIEKPISAAYDENDQEILGALGNSLGAIISNARLLEEIRKQVDRQRQLYEITSKIRRSADIQSILETSAVEISKVVHAKRAHIEITTNETIEPDSPTKHNGDNGKEVLE
jgi:PAS domain S-box-containing protein